MKLVEVLAKELKEWPNRAVYFTQDDCRSAYPYVGIPSRLDSVASIMWSAGGQLCGIPSVKLSLLASDHATAIVTRADWEAERARIAKPAKANKDGWIRHRGGRCPVVNGVKIDFRMRHGAVLSGCDIAETLRWIHREDSGDIMAYRLHVEDKPITTEFIGPFPASSSEESIEVDISFPSVVVNLRDPHAVNPMIWRDRITEIDVTTEQLTTERADLVQKLAGEGFSLIDRVAEVVMPVEDMSDWRNWKVGDVLEMIGAKNWVDVTDGRLYKLVEPVKGGFSIIDDVGKSRDFGVGRKEYAAIDFKFHSRPSA